MAASHVQHKFALNDGASSLAFTFDTNPTTGNLICGLVQFAKTVTLTSVSDGTNTYTLLRNPTDGSASNNYRAAMFYAENITGGALTITITLSGTGLNLRTVAHEVAGVDTVAPLNGNAINAQDNTVNPATNAITSGAVAVSVGDYVAGLTFSQSGADQSPGTNFTQAYNNAAFESEYLIAGSGGTIAATFTNVATDFWLTGVMTFKVPGSGPVYRNISTMRVPNLIM